MRRTILTLFLALAAPVVAFAGDLQVHGLLDLVLSSGDDARYTNVLTQGDSNFDPYRLHVFVNAKVASQLDVYLESIVHEGYSTLRADGAYAMWTPWANRDAHVEAGKVPWPIGTWASRSYSDKNPLVGTPLMYQYHTSLSWGAMAPGADALVANAGLGQVGLTYANNTFGMPVVDDRWWDVGAVALGSQNKVEYTFGVMQGSPGWPVTTSDDTPGQTVLGRLGLAPTAGVRAGVSGSWGTWMPDWFSFQLPADRSPRDYHEGLVMGDLELERGSWELRSESFLKEWDTSTAGTLHLHGGYAEAKVGVGETGAWLAARYDILRFSEVTLSSGLRAPWDQDVDRLETGVGYRVSRDVRVKAVFQRDTGRPFGAAVRHSDVYALAASIRM
jgi:hypothetical protein